VLSRVLRRLQPIRREEVMVGLDAPDDAAVFVSTPGQVNVQTVDFFRSFVADPYLFGRIAANHCLGDIHAMGAEPRWALAVAVVPFGAEGQVEEQLFQLLSGAVRVLNAEGAALAGGHTAEGHELAFGLVVNGSVDPTRLFRKGGLRHGDRLILTKPLGTGVLFAAEMRRKTRARWIEGAIASMLRSNREAAACFRSHGVNGCTDVTGFGLLGHLVEMLQAARLRAVIQLADLPVLAGTLECFAAGITSSLQRQNLRLRRMLADFEKVSTQEMLPVLFVPQTAGGLLAGVSADKANACLAELRAGGYTEAAIIGEVESGEAGDETVVSVR